jgi:hypothetical protein
MERRISPTSASRAEDPPASGWLGATSRAPGRREPLPYEIFHEIRAQGALALPARSGDKVGRRHAGRMTGRSLHEFDPVAVGVGQP